MKMGTVVKIAFLVATIAFFAGCGGMQSSSGSSGFRYFAANCYASDSSNSTFWCSNPPKVTPPVPTPTPSPSPGTSQ